MNLPLVLRYRVSLVLFLIGLIFSGLSAFPLLTEIRILSRFLGIDEPSRYLAFTGLSHWIAFVHFGLEETYERFPFFGYGTDWLAFGHLASAAFFIRPLRHPLDSDWVLKTGLWICGAVIPVAFIAGQVRGIPVYWSLLDSAFGVFGSLPLFYCLRISRKMQVEFTS
jgi:hypothetical protein